MSAWYLARLVYFTSNLFHIGPCLRLCVFRQVPLLLAVRLCLSVVWLLHRQLWKFMIEFLLLEFVGVNRLRLHEMPQAFRIILYIWQPTFFFDVHVLKLIFNLPLIQYSPYVTLFPLKLTLAAGCLRNTSV